MRNTYLYEGGKPRTFGSLAQIETDRQSGDDHAPWVPAVDYLGMNKYISENGTYKVEDEAPNSDGNGFWAYTKVTVNVYGGAAGVEPKEFEPTDSDDQWGSDDQGDSEDQWDSDDPSDPQEPDWDEETVVQDVEPAGTIDSDGNVKKGAITGTDPETGKTVMVRVTEVKDPTTGEKKSVLEKVNVPVAIRIGVPPDKTVYSDGDTINYSGIQVFLYEEYEETTEEGGSFDVKAKPFKDTWYPDSKIPYDELIFPIRNVGDNAGEDAQWTDPNTHIHVGDVDIGGPISYVEDTLRTLTYGWGSALSVASGYVWSNTNYNYKEEEGAQYSEGFNGFGDLALAFSPPALDVDVRITSYKNQNDEYTAVVAWKTPSQASFVQRACRLGLKIGYPSSRTIKTATYQKPSDGSSPSASTVYYCAIDDENLSNYGYATTSPRAVSENVTTARDVAARIAWYMWNGSFSKDSVPVQWVSPYDGATFQDTFRITIIGNENE